MRALIGRMAVIMVLAVAIAHQPCFAIDKAMVVGQKEEMAIAARSADRVIQDAAIKEGVISIKEDIEKYEGEPLESSKESPVLQGPGNQSSGALPQEICWDGPIYEKDQAADLKKGPAKEYIETYEKEVLNSSKNDSLLPNFEKQPGVILPRETSLECIIYEKAPTPDLKQGPTLEIDIGLLRQILDHGYKPTPTPLPKVPKIITMKRDVNTDRWQHPDLLSFKPEKPDYRGATLHVVNYTRRVNVDDGTTE